ncbi:hypothetical protein BX616_008986 [Lobosporangium transversale]|uniref:Uncharacterized protein n=1 Tax=Lobosporangium transversale TaxID=64571 RepID=A0A1Y2GFE2_9FUNG|nr:hypothetical protein BCR41DRAFT_360137 [Lobosporangium transversale]KAF9914091.1 hypothetical protein BX616_008986 [Lobosporangium transversale]ORZ07524.1 hypothetical protein BCR41DRAFT_360137 [Lobosporangium transversale]|eukprot:XP_021878031.1 hypothetical protein BCR41DRAFT_360137 [Lobosporangium transversale]
MYRIQVLILALLGLAVSVQAYCKRAVGIRVMTNNNCRVAYCGPRTCYYQPCHYIWIYHDDGSYTGGFQIAAAANFNEGKQDQVYEWAFYGTKDGKGMSVFANGCGGNGGNGGLGGMGCEGKAVRRTNISLPGVSKVYYDCGRLPPVPK